MAKSPIDLDGLMARLAGMGLVGFGQFTIDESHCAAGREHFIGREALLIGNAGPAMWDVFSQSDEYADGTPDPMNRWTKARIDPLADELGGQAIYPFDQPYWPFQRFAVAATGMRQSPLGLLIHPQFGLWQAFRSAVIFPAKAEIASHFNSIGSNFEAVIHPCDTCTDKPCLRACPVKAFDGDTLNVNSCFGHLDSGAEPDCMKFGCRARAACPVGEGKRYDNKQVAFHMHHYRS